MIRDRKIKYFLAAASLVAIGLLGWYLWRHYLPTSAPNNTTILYDEDPYADWNYYTSKKGEFFFRHPEILALIGWQGDNVVDKFGISGYEDTLQFIAKSNLEIKEDNFSLTIKITDSKPPDSSFGNYLNGTTQTLPNTLTIWQEKSNPYSTCPSLRIGRDSSFATRLKNGKYLSITGTFCWAADVTTSLTYEQQVKSNEWQTAVSIIKSFTFN